MVEESSLTGFLTAIGWVGQDGADPLEGVDAAAVFAWIDNYCSAHPLDQIVIGAEQFSRAHPHR